MHQDDSSSSIMIFASSRVLVLSSRIKQLFQLVSHNSIFLIWITMGRMILYISLSRENLVFSMVLLKRGSSQRRSSTKLSESRSHLIPTHLDELSQRTIFHRLPDSILRRRQQDQMIRPSNQKYIINVLLLIPIPRRHLRAMTFS